MKLKCITIALLTVIISCNSANSQNLNNGELATIKERQDSIIQEHLVNRAWKYELFSNEWQEEIDKGLAKDSTIAYLWQQKAMPLFKQGKYEVGMKYIDKAVQFDSDRYLDYRAFIKCIFAKNYKEAIQDFEDSKTKYGNRYVMDHSYNFYIALSHIQLNNYKEAEKLLIKNIEEQIIKSGEDWVHYLDLFYLGISQMEQKKYKESIVSFDKSLKLYPEFSEAIYYKGYCHKKLGNNEDFEKLTHQAVELGKKGYSINEDNAIYERYPYQIKWKDWF